MGRPGPRTKPHEGQKSYNGDPGEPLPTLDDDGNPVESADEELPAQNIGDILELDPARIANLRRRKVDTVIDKIRVFVVNPETGKKTRLEGDFPPDLVTTAWLQRKEGAGRYQVVGLNKRCEYIGATVTDIRKGKRRDDEDDDDDEDDEPRGRGMRRLESILERQSATIEKLLTTISQPRQDPIRDSVAAMATMFQAQAAAQLQSLEMQMKVRDHVNGPGQASQNEALAIVKELAFRQPASPQSQNLDLLKLGLALGARMNGAPAPNSEKRNEWLDFATDLSDNVGVPLVAAICQAVLPPEKARQAIEAINMHSEARIREANVRERELENEGEEEP